MNGQIKKASSAVTPKASHLAVVSNLTKERPMNNSNAVNLNNQVDQAYNAASNALDLVGLSIEIMNGLDALLDAINSHSKDDPSLHKITSLTKLGRYYTDNLYANLAVQKSDLEKSMNGLLGGFAHE